MKRRRTTPPPPPQQNAAMNPNYLDRFSDLPEPIIHHIVSFVPTKYAARTSALSKRFRSAWLSFPVVDFDATLFPGRYRDTTSQFTTFVRDALNRRDPNACLEKLRIRGLFDGSTFNHWLVNYALDKHVKQIYLFDDSYVDTCLPQRMFCANSIRVLELKGFKVEVPDLILSCPLIEDFRVTNCSGLKSIRVSGAKKLKAVKLDTCSGLEKIDIDAQNLESFSYTGCRDVDPSQPPQPCEILTTACKSLKTLSLEFASIMDLWLYDHVSKFPFLKILKLYECRGLKYISLFHTNIEEIELKNCDGLEMVGIVAQNLQSFVYRMNRRKQCDINISAGKFLRNLILHGATITDRWIEDNMSAFCLLERLGLQCCNVLQKIKFHNANINEIELKNCDGLETVDIVAQNLQSFVYSMDRSKQCDINISACKCLRNLILRGATITDRWIQDNISAFCLLERLRLECCKVLQKIKFHNELLTCFELHDCDVEEAEIDAPNLNSFDYTGQIMAPPVIISSHWDAMIKLKETDLPPYLWFKKLREFLLGFDTCKVLTLICNNDKVTILYNFFILIFTSSFLFFLFFFFIFYFLFFFAYFVFVSPQNYIYVCCCGSRNFDISLLKFETSRSIITQTKK